MHCARDTRLSYGTYLLARPLLSARQDFLVGVSTTEDQNRCEFGAGPGLLAHHLAYANLPVCEHADWCLAQIDMSDRLKLHREGFD